MCLIIDACVLSCVFSPLNKHHSSFKPVFDWIIHGNGVIITGGSVYRKETQLKVTKYNKLFIELKRQNKLRNCDNERVDALTQRVKSLERHADFDDPHLIALIRVSKCRIICTNDTRAIKFLTMKRLYEKDTKPPFIYQSTAQLKILSNSNISDFCKPCKKLPKRTKQRFAELIHAIKS